MSALEKYNEERTIELESQLADQLMENEKLQKAFNAGIDVMDLLAITTAERDKLKEDLKNIPEQCNRLNEENNKLKAERGELVRVLEALADFTSTTWASDDEGMIPASLANDEHTEFNKIIKSALTKLNTEEKE